MNLNMLQTRVLVVALVQMCLTSMVLAGESLVGVWVNDHHAALKERKLVLGDVPPLPADVRADLTAFNAEFQSLPQSLNSHTTSPNGRAIAFGRYSGSSDALQPSGVYVWPDWREADIYMAFKGFSHVEFKSNHHVYLRHWPREHGPISQIVDLRHPHAAFKFEGYSRKFLRISDDGRWACVDREGRLCVGRLDPQNPANSMTLVEVPVTGEVENLMFRHNGEILLVELKNETLVSYLSSGGPVLDTTQGGMWHEDSTIEQDKFFGWNDAEDGVVTFTVALDGALSYAQWPLLDGEYGEEPIYQSPSGKYLTTKQDMEPIGHIKYRVRKTPLAAPDEAVPTRPETHPDGGRHSFGWLSW